MHTVSMSAFFDELIKIAKTRMVSEAQQAAAEGNMDYLKQLGAAQTASTPGMYREVKNLGRGAEGMTQLMLGKHPGLEGDLHVRKLYDPQSPITQQQYTTDLLDRKQKATDIMRQVAGEQGGKVHVPAMTGAETLHADKGPGMLRHVSRHEFVPNIKAPFELYNINPATEGVQKSISSAVSKLQSGDMQGAISSAHELPAHLRAMKDSPLEQVHNVLQESGKRLGANIGDAVTMRGVGGVSHIVNPGNVVMSDGRPTILDVLPAGGGLAEFQANKGGQQALKALRGELTPSAVLAGAPELGDKALQKEIFNPSIRVTPPTPVSKLQMLEGAGEGMRKGVGKLTNMARDAITSRGGVRQLVGGLLHR